jgi:hypothetical protein
MKDCCDNCKEGKECCSVHEGGMGVLTSDQADVLQGIVLRNKNKNLKAILNVALKSGYFKNVDKKELLGYIDGAKQFVKYMKSHPMESVNEMPNFGRGTSGLPKGFTDDYYKIVKKLSKGKGYLTLSKSDKKKVWAILGKIYTESVTESDLGYTYKKGKTVKVKHTKSGKELVIVDKPAVRKKYEKLGFFAEGKVNEARNTNTEWNKFEKDYGDFFKTVVKLGKANTKLTGDKTDEKIFLTNFTRNVGKFYTLMKSWKRGQKESVNEAVEPKGNMAKIAKVVKDSQATKLSGVMIDMQSANLLMKLWDAVSDKDKEKMNKMNARLLTTIIKKLWSRINLKLPI